MADSLNKVMKTAASKVTGEKVAGAARSGRRYAQSSSVAIVGMRDTQSGLNGLRMAQSTSNSSVTSPNFYTPFTTPSAFQIPNARKEVYLWAQWWFDNEPKVAAAIEFYTDFPLSGFELECGNGYVKDYFEELVKKLNFSKWLPLISQEYHLRGDVFIMAGIDCQHCHGTNEDEDGEPCKHDGATWGSLCVLNPDTIESSGYFLDQEPTYHMMATEDMVTVVMQKTPKELYDKIPDNIKQKILQRGPIVLDPISIHHLKRGAAPWQPYGTSMVRRLFPTLAYKDKLRQAQWLVAERHIIPIKIVTIGSDDRPASDEDIESAQEELTNVANDPLLTLVTHHNFKLDYVGACHDETTEVLTLDGFKLFENVLSEDKIACYNIKTSNLEYHNYQEKHQYYYNSEEFGPMINFSGKHLDSMVTPNHHMLTKKRKWNASKNKYEFNEWTKVEAQYITDHDKFLTTTIWDGFVPEKISYTDIPILKDIELKDFMSILGYYLSEGSQQWDKKINKPYTTKISQKNNTDIYFKMYDLFIKCFGDKTKKTINKTSDVCELKIHNEKMARYFYEEFGYGCENKKIPIWIKNLPSEFLTPLLQSLMDGDGNVVVRNNREKFKYTTTSKQLSNDVQEIALKLGYNPKISIGKREQPHHKTKYIIYWPEKREYRTIKSINIKKINYNGNVWCFTVPTGVFITRRNGKIGIHGNSGKVLTLSNEYELIDQDIIDGFMLNKAILNGEGPSYNNAQVGLLTMSKRLERFRLEVSHWIEEKLFKPIAEWNGFTVEGKRGQEELIYPTIKWNDLELRDNTGKLQIMQTAQQAGVISVQTFLEELDIPYDQEVERLRFESTAGFISTPDSDTTGGGMGGGYGGGGGGGGLADLLGGGGAPPAGEEAAGGMPPEGGAPMPGGEPGAPPPVGASVATMENYRFASEILNKIYATKREPIDKEISRRFASKEIKGEIHKGFIESVPVVTGRGKLGPLPENPDIFFGAEMTYPINGGKNCIPLNPEARRESAQWRYAAKKDEKQAPQQLFTKLEQGLYKTLLSMNIPYPLYAQYQSGNGLQYQLDAAYPSIKLGVEADSRTFHNSPEKIASDKQRDMNLAAQGWTILRFTEEEINEQPQEIVNVIMNVAKQLAGGNVGGNQTGMM